MSTANGWEQMAEHWDAGEGDKGSNWHRALLHPALRKVLGPLGGQYVLDVGCGNGSLARQLARQGAHALMYLRRRPGWQSMSHTARRGGVR
jgi:2-polyprenyl-3-methyl-5-hydroxy-6-metoxy-1,4-benzoquinol methylase